MKNWLDGMKGKKWGPTLLIGLFALALLLLLLAGNGSGDAHTTQERRIGEVLGRIAGAGHVEVMIYDRAVDGGLLGEKSTTVGAVVVAEGAADLGVRLQLIRAVRTLLGLPETAVEVFEMGEAR